MVEYAKTPKVASPSLLHPYRYGAGGGGLSVFEPWEIKTHRPRRRRKPTIAGIARQAIKAGATRATLAPDGTVTLEFPRADHGEVMAHHDGSAAEPANPWDEVLP